MKRIILFFVLFMGDYWVTAQTFPSEIWHEGKIVLMEGDTLTGKIKYNLETDLVQFRKDLKTIKTFTARKLLHFEIFDETVNRYRQFYALPYNLNGNYKAPIIFEVLIQGELTLLCREAVEYQVTNYPYSMSGTYTRLVLTYTYYFLKPDGTITDYSGKKKDLLYIMSKKQGDMKKFIKSNRIKTDEQIDLAKAVRYYNSLFDQS